MHADDLLDQFEAELRASDHPAISEGGVDRRRFMLLSLIGAAATAFGAESVRAQGGGAGGGARTGAPGAQGQGPMPFAPLGNGEAPAEQFMPYPGGTGALMERLLKERGAKAFERGTFTVEPWKGAVPTAAETIAFLPAHRLAALIKARKITSARLTDIYLERLKRLNPKLNCVVTLLEDAARAEAAQADREIAAGRYRGALHGLPYGLKDLFSTKGVPTTWGAKDFETRIIDEDAEIVVRLREAGAVLVAKLATGLFAQNDQWFRGRTNNPWNLVQGSSGSSAGPASATAAGCVAFSIGTETQGSIVSPSTRCGLSALRPTFGRVSRYGGMVLAWSHDRVGPMCRTVEDCAMVFHVIHGASELDPSTVTTPFRFDRRVDLAALRIGADANAPKELVEQLKALGATPRDIGPRPTVAGAGNGLNTEYAAAFDAYVQRKAKEIGLDLTTLPEPRAPGAPMTAADSVAMRAANAAAAANPMAPADWNPRFVTGRTVRAFEFLQSQRRRLLLVQQWGAFMRDLDMFVGNPLADVAPNAQTGHPCVVVPYTFAVPAAVPPRPGAAPVSEGLQPQPICGVIVGALYQDDRILSVAHRLQEGNQLHTRRPALG